MAQEEGEQRLVLEAQAVVVQVLQQEHAQVVEVPPPSSTEGVQEHFWVSEVVVQPSSQT